MNSFSVKLFVLILAFTSFSFFCNAQPTEDTQSITSMWLQSGLGGSSLGGASGIASLNYQADQWLFSARLTGTSNNEWFSDDSESLFEAGVLAGVAGTLNEKRLFWYSFGGGLSFVNQTECVENCGILSSQPAVKETTSTIGIPLEAQLVWRPFRVAGLGIHGTANLNAVVPFGAAHIVLQLGNFR